MTKEDERIRRMTARNAWRIIQMTSKDAARRKVDWGDAVRRVKAQLEVVEQMNGTLFSR